MEQSLLAPSQYRLTSMSIDSRFADQYYYGTSDFMIKLPSSMRNVMRIALSSVEIPEVAYVFSAAAGNTSFTVNTTSYSIPDGNYTAQSLVNTINAIAAQNIATSDLVVSFNSADNRISFKNNNFLSDAITIVFFIQANVINYNNCGSISLTQFQTLGINSTLGWLMGFRLGYYENNATYVSEGLIDLLGPRYIYLVVDDFHNNVSDGFYGAFTSSLLNKNILARITLQGSVFNIIAQNNLLLVSTARQYFGPVDIQKMQIQLLDEYGRILDLNNMDYSFCLSFQTIYDL